MLGALLVLILLGGAGPASAHAALRSGDPADGTVLKSAPRSLTLTFTESIGLLDGSFRLFDPEGHRVHTGEAQHAPGHPDTARVAFPAGLGEGTFTVAWRVVSADSHPVSGAFTFSVGKPSATAAAIDTGRAEDPTTGSLYDLARYAAYGAAALLIGTAAFALLCRPPDTGPLRRPLAAGWWALLAATVVLLVLRAPYETGTGPASAFGPGALSRTLTGRSGLVLLARLALLAPTAVFLVRLFGRRDGEAERARADRGPSRPALVAGAALALALALTWAASEHASAGIQVPLAMTSSVLHLLAMAVWLGGLMALLATLHRAPATATGRNKPTGGTGGAGGTGRAVGMDGMEGMEGTEGTDGARAPSGAGGARLPAVTADAPGPAAAPVSVTAAAPGSATATADVSQPPATSAGAGPGLTPAVARFSRIAFAAVSVLVVTGVYQSWRGLGSWAALADTEYGRLLLAKLAAVALLLAVAGRSRRWTARLVTAEAEAAVRGGMRKPAAREGAQEPVGGAPTPTAEEPAWSAAPDAHRRRLRRSVLAEVAVGIAVLVVTTVLTGTLPGRAAAEAAEAGPVAGGPGASVTVIPFDVGTTGGRGKVQITLEPGRVGQNAVEAVVFGPDGGLATVPELRLSLSLPAQRIGPIDARLTDKGGYWGTDSLNLPIPGTWTMKATVRVSELDQVSESKTVRILR
ncbi:copper resistance protein CopC [Streptomyces sp. NPDC020801]|uniref:copper resistance CopC/CopD family protein n=1 Tax=unclassified Streptomyces TaxID=2593676 RepID=UPI0037A9B4CD